MTSERLALLASAKNLKGTSPIPSSVPFWMVRVPLVIAEAMTGKALSPANKPIGAEKLYTFERLHNSITSLSGVLLAALTAAIKLETSPGLTI